MGVTRPRFPLPSRARRRARGTRQAVLRLISTIITGTGLATLTLGCGASTAGLSNPSVTVCYRAIPVAKAAVHEETAKFVGVRRLPADRAAKLLPFGNRSGTSSRLSVCAVAFEGHFAFGQVQGTPGDQQGRYAVVLVTMNHLGVLTSVVVDHLPKTFRGDLV